ncbi:hypothetical protein CNMCM5623_005142 [Aspergillus felis]|uniref:ML-like domain-containing protein n=1 Tax=Aspergillus felis TaxID=1287682 RepID=A0A8H6R4A5_9EURO|nr:hypothetical protein CNMCM5623_005142 [Aspergillus felis]KAF7184343.1 hypothetical protein CNMCM7691_005095 [Aspergillus felis]
MRLMPIIFSLFLAFLLSPLVSATKLIESNALDFCQDSSNFTATFFSVTFTPNNRSLAFAFDGVASISGKVTAELILTTYGYEALRIELDPCEMNLAGLCPMNSGPIDVPRADILVSEDVAKQIPDIAYMVPNLDAKVRIYINSTDTGKSITCIEASLSNGKTVYQKGIGWTTAIISGFGLAASAITSGLGHSNTAAHVAANALSLFSFMQSQAMFGMISVAMPPIVEAWTQNFQWSMGIIHIGFLENLCTWYQRSTGGTPSTILSKLSTTSVEILKRRKRSIGATTSLMERPVNELVKRSGAASEAATSLTVVVRGIQRVGFAAGIEQTNIFLTGLIFFVSFVFVVMVIVAFFKAGCEVLTKNGDKFSNFQNGWKVVARGILFRLILIGFPQMCVLCLWEFTQHDSTAEVLLAVTMFLSLLGAVGWAAFKVILLAKRSVVMHENPAYIQYSDPTCLNKWGFLYVQYRATAYYFVVPALVYSFIKGTLIGLSQPAGVVQAVALVVVEAAMLIAESVLRPWMDKKTNIYNITIAAINFVNAFCLLFFSEVFNQPGLVTSIMGVIFFVYNAASMLVLLILVLIASIHAIVSKNPDTHYQPMRADRDSFIKSLSQLTTELDALGATTHGDPEDTSFSSPFNDDSDSFSSGNGASIRRQNLQASHDTTLLAPVVDPSVPLFPSAGWGLPSYDRSTSPAPYRSQYNASLWQRGAGYDQ